MKRDTIKPDSYFQKTIASQEKRIAQFSGLLADMDTSNALGIARARLYLANFNRDLLKLYYSAGYPLEQVYRCYLEYLTYEMDICKQQDSLYEMIDLLSIGVLFCRRKEEFMPLIRRIMKDTRLKDGFLLYLYQYLEGTDLQVTESGVDYFNSLVNSPQKSEGLEAALKKWYSDHKDASWYDSHRSSQPVYYGYWCFEIAALAKIWKINDDKWVDEPYYPYELAHL